MIIIKGQDIHLQREDKSWINPPMNYGMIHDPEGLNLDRCYVYIGPFKKSKEKIQLDADARNYFGNRYEGTAVVVDIPNGSWKQVCNIIQILYKRRGQFEGKYFHMFKKNTQVILSKCGKYYRLEFPDNCVVNWRGFVYP